MSEMPWVRFYPSDWLAGTRGLSAAETGVYITLISMMYESRRAVTADDKRLAMVCGASLHKFRKAIASLQRYGHLVEEGGSYSAPRLFARWRALSGRGSIPRDLRKAVFDRDGEQCAYCGADTGPFHIDHVFPVSLGGSNEIDNLTVACVPCNRAKGAKLVAEWLQ